MNTRALLILALILSSPVALAASPEEAAHRAHAAASAGDSDLPASIKIPEPKLGATIAMDAASGKAVRVGEILAANEKVIELVDKANTRIRLAPYTVVEFAQSGEMKLLRGSAVLESRDSRTVKTSSAQVEFAGRLLLSYDHKERSTSAFVLDGEARMVNPQDAERSLRLERLRGATLEVGGVLPQLVRDLDFSSVQAWMQGYAWPKQISAEILKFVPEKIEVAEHREPAHLESVKLEDYFSAVDNGDDVDEPDYYDKKFADPDKVMAEAKISKEGAKKVLSPEEAALISLPTHKVDLEFDILSEEKKNEELSLARTKREAAKGRALASVKEAAKRPKPVKTADGIDPEVKQVLDRLREIRAKAPVVSGVSRSSSRSPASVENGLVPDPVYDYSENF